MIDARYISQQMPAGWLQNYSSTTQTLCIRKNYFMRYNLKIFTRLFSEEY